MATLVKDKNFMVFTTNDERVYKFDMAKGIFLSTKGNPMKTAPTGFATYMQNARNLSNAMQYIYRKHYNDRVSYANMSEYADYIGICDRLDSIGYVVNDWWYLKDNSLDFIAKHFKAFAKAIKETPELNIQDFVNSYGKIEFFERLGLKESEYYTTPILNCIWDWREQFNDKQLVYIAYYLSRGVYEFFNDEHRYGSRVQSSWFKDFFKWAEILDYTPTKDDFFKQYLVVKKNYKVHKAEFDNKAIDIQLGKHSNTWKFENDEYMVVVPHTTKEFEDEANQQGNCVYSMYLERVINGETNVVFIRRKDNPTKSVITCEVRENGYIQQYLAKGNRSVDCNSSAYAFKKAFEEYIKSTWNK